MYIIYKKGGQKQLKTAKFNPISGKTLTNKKSKTKIGNTANEKIGKFRQSVVLLAK